jgi:hypothetical protein
MVFVLSLITVSEMAVATQPRITPGLLSPDRLEIFTHEYPPLASLDIPSGGLYPEIIQAAFCKENVEVAITILHVKSLVKYNLLLDNAIAIIGEGWNFSEAEREQLMVMPFCIIEYGYYYYRPAHKQELSKDENLASLYGYEYRAQKGEDVAAFIQVGISISFGNIISHYKKLIDKKIDFLSA